MASIKKYPENGGHVLSKCQNCIRIHGVPSQRTHLQSCQRESGMQGEWVARTINNIPDYMVDQRYSVHANSTHFLFFERKYSARPKFLYMQQCHVPLLFVIFKDFSHFNGTKKGKKIFLLLFKKIHNYIIKLSLSQPRKHTSSALDLRIELENFGSNSEQVERTEKHAQETCHAEFHIHEI